MTTPETTAPEQATKTPIWKKKWFWYTIGAIVALGIIGNLLGSGTTDSTPATPPAAEQPEPAPEPTEPSTPATDEPAALTDTERATILEEAIKLNALGGQDFTEALATDPTLWAGWITNVRVDGTRAFITLQVANNAPERDDLGERAATALPKLLAADTTNPTEGINWLIIEDASGVVIDQARTS